ncbi:SubName: Full=Uncharacterized protein {ECO:0000313/EMBL:CCA68691.1} [Serendipita indica DSM 11827]|uniref:Uncharacterized protein n=1 Tax=Serendipita indica (strain DSM 11827) TaxID=1109443 RepID=G4TBJ5_SERID|nr:SubName: Full=Uncharacterized protein {ECO:0000313/EMBL:CCA68691.1} [Serendipita indica DSM 11827]CCA68691.1 hypothetical protein PIIN_02556 [Serendipita indica DSM 11827]
MSSQNPVRKSMTGKHRLVIAKRADFVRQRAGGSLSVLSLLFGKGTVIYRIWPAVFIHTVFSAIVVAIDLYYVNIGVGTIMLTLIPMVLGFVVALRVTTGYDRYWMGRVAWSDVIRNTRTLGRLIWYHCPTRLTPNRENVPLKDIERALEEKKLALDLLEAFAFALKHHIRDEPGPYYEDLNPLLAAMELSPYHTHRFPSSPPMGSPAAAVNGLPSNGDQYGTFPTSNDPHAPLLPATQSRRTRGSVYVDLIPFGSWWTAFKRLFSRQPAAGTPTAGPEGTNAGKHVVLAGGGGNIPLEVLRTLSEWLSTLEERGTVPGTTLGSMMGLVQGLEDSLCSLERILTTPLPLVYTAHIRHTVWIFLFTLPFQLCNTFEWITVPGVAVASFLYLGFVAAGEEIEQPFGYDRNDLDLDFFCNEIIHVELDDLRRAQVPNSYLSLPGAVQPTSTYGRGAIVDAATQEAEQDVKDFNPAEPLAGVPSGSY